MRGEGGVLVRGNFTPIRSGHLPPQRQVHEIYGMPITGTGQGQRTMTGALPDDQPARVVRFEDRIGTVNRNLRGRDGQQGAKPKKTTEREERTGKWLKTTCWFIFCCGLCEEWDLAAEGDQHGVQNVVVRGGGRRYRGRFDRYQCVQWKNGLLDDE